MRDASVIRIDSILDVAEIELATRGIEAASMRAIAKKAGITAGTIYYHCGSKLGLIFDVYERAIARIHSAMEASIAGHHELQAIVDDFVARLFGLFVESPSIPTFLVQFCFGDVRGARRSTALLPLRALMANQLATRAQQGMIARVDPETFFAAASGVVLHLVRRLHRDGLLQHEPAVRMARDETARFILGALRYGVSQATPSYP